MTSTFLKAVARKNTDHLPVWFMRQAGRYLPEYMKLKDKHDFRTRTHTPELMTEITLQPIRRYPLDAAIMFSDILTCLEFMGAEFDFTGEGPKLAGAGVPVLKKLRPLKVEDMKFVADGIRSIRNGLGETPLIGFVGAPFTLASYIIEGGTSKEFLKTRKFMLEEPSEFLRCMDLLADSVGRYLQYQVEAGVQAVQIFDSWVGFLSLDTYEEMILPSIQKIVKMVHTTGKPVILYSQPTEHLLPALAKSGADVLSVDWRSSISRIATRLKELGVENISLQGNLDPVVTTLNFEQAKPHVDRLLKDIESSGFRSKFIFNVGHGVSPMTNPETVGKIIEYVRGK